MTGLYPYAYAALATCVLLVIAGSLIRHRDTNRRGRHRV